MSGPVSFSHYLFSRSADFGKHTYVIKNQAELDALIKKLKEADGGKLSADYDSMLASMPAVDFSRQTVLAISAQNTEPFQTAHIRFVNKRDNELHVDYIGESPPYSSGFPTISDGRDTRINVVVAEISPNEASQVRFNDVYVEKQGRLFSHETWASGKALDSAKTGEFLIKSREELNGFLQALVVAPPPPYAAQLESIDFLSFWVIGLIREERAGHCRYVSPWTATFNQTTGMLALEFLESPSPAGGDCTVNQKKLELYEVSSAQIPASQIKAVSFDFRQLFGDRAVIECPIVYGAGCGSGTVKPTRPTIKRGTRDE